VFLSFVRLSAGPAGNSAGSFIAEKRAARQAVKTPMSGARGDVHPPHHSSSPPRPPPTYN